MILTPQALSGRGSRWRLENAVSAFNVRSGTDKLNGTLWHKMSQEARDANSTRELSKLSKEEQREARLGNAGKHDANAGGWARPKEDRMLPLDAIPSLDTMPSLDGTFPLDLMPPSHEMLSLNEMSDASLGWNFFPELNVPPGWDAPSEWNDFPE